MLLQFFFVPVDLCFIGGIFFPNNLSDEFSYQCNSQLPSWVKSQGVSNE